MRHSTPSAPVVGGSIATAPGCATEPGDCADDTFGMDSVSRQNRAVAIDRIFRWPRQISGVWWNCRRGYRFPAAAARERRRQAAGVGPPVTARVVAFERDVPDAREIRFAVRQTRRRR